VPPWAAAPAMRPICWRSPPRHDLEGSPRQELREPGILPGFSWARLQYTASARRTNIGAASSGRPVWRSVRASACPRSNRAAHHPIHGRRKSRPGPEEYSGSATVATIAVAPKLPDPPDGLNPRLASLRAILASHPLFDRSRHSPTPQAAQTSTMELARASIGNRLPVRPSRSRAILGRRVAPAPPRTPARPDARKALMSGVRWLISTSRVAWLQSTDPAVRPFDPHEAHGRSPKPLAIASASAASVFGCAERLPSHPFAASAHLGGRASSARAPNNAGRGNMPSSIRHGGKSIAKRNHLAAPELPSLLRNYLLLGVDPVT